MGTAIAKRETSLAGIFEPLSKSQQLYLTFVLADYSKGEARRMANVLCKTVDGWDRDDEFRQIEEHVLANRRKYIGEVTQTYSSAIGLKALVALSFLVDKAMEWDKLDRSDKPYVSQALQTFAKLGIGPRGQDIGSYDELILKRHVKHGSL